MRVRRCLSGRPAFYTIGLSLVISAAAAIGFFVHTTTSQVREALPVEVLEQQQDIAYMVHGLSELWRVVDVMGSRPGGFEPAGVRAQVRSIRADLDSVRVSYSFDRLVGATRMHALMNPALQDLERWLSRGIAGFAPDSPQVLRVVRLRVSDTSRRVNTLFESTGRTSAQMVRREQIRLEQFRRSLVLYLAVFAVFAAAVVVLFVRQRFSEARVSRERKRLIDSIESIGDGYVLFDRDDRLVLCNERFRDISPRVVERLERGETFADAVRAVASDLSMRDTDTGESFSFEERIERHSRPAGTFELRWPGGRTVRVSEHRTRDGGTVGVYTEITDLKDAQARLEHMASHDALTGLANRTYLEEHLEHAIARARRHATPLAVMYFDLDRFKQVNDTYGHAGGDELLRRVADTLRATLREEDLVARLGGDEFAAVLESVPSWSELAATADRAIKALAAAFDIGGARVYVTSSIGIALYPEDGDTSPALRRNADAACYHAKAVGRNNYQFYSAEMNKQSSRRTATERELRAAADRDEFGLRYQPVMDVATGQISGVEALLRWHSAELGEVPPSEFIPIAEDSGLIMDIGARVLEDACGQLGEWRRMGLGQFKMAVKVSARQLHSRSLLASVRQAIAAAAVEPADLYLEITESTLMENIPTAQETLDALHGEGVPICIDDFGVGYSSLSALKRFPLAVLKIDRSFVSDIASDSSDLEIVSAVIAMAHKLKVRVVAEGVEEQAQFDILERLGCDGVQGQWISGPLDATQATAFLTDALARDTAGSTHS